MLGLVDIVGLGGAVRSAASVLGSSAGRALGIAGLCAAELAGCHGTEPPPAPAAIVVAGTVHARANSSAADTLRYPVEAVARYSNVMSFRVAGKLIERRVRLGDAVRKGQVLARLDSIDAENQAAIAVAGLDAGEHRLIFAKQQLDRDRAQAAQNLIARSQLEQTEDAYVAALAARQQAAAQRAVARNTLHYHSLLADHDGVITSENADTGQVVSAGQAIYGLAWTGATDVELDAAAGDLGRISVGQPAAIEFSALPHVRFDAQVREIAPAADAQSRTYRVKLTLLKPGSAAGATVHFGMTGDAILSHGANGSEGRADPVFSVPATSIFHRGNEPAVWRIRGADSTLELEPVVVGSYSERFATITGGLRDGDRIVLAGVHTVFNGQHVKPVDPLFSAEAGSPASDVTARPTSDR